MGKCDRCQGPHTTTFQDPKGRKYCRKCYKEILKENLARNYKAIQDEEEKHRQYRC